MGDLWLLRHGQTEWSKSGRHTGWTDVPLTAAGEAEAAAWAATPLASHPFAAVVCSPLRRAAHTAELAGVTVTEVDEDLREWQYGEAEGLTTAELRQDRPGWDVWADGPPGGETLAELSERVDRALARIEPRLEEGDVLVVAHGHLLRVLAARRLGQPASLGAYLRLESATLAVLGHEHERRVVREWGLRP